MVSSSLSIDLSDLLKRTYGRTKCNMNNKKLNKFADTLVNRGKTQVLMGQKDFDVIVESLQYSLMCEMESITPTDFPTRINLIDAIDQAKRISDTAGTLLKLVDANNNRKDK